MPNRPRLYDFRLSDGPSDIGLCSSDIVGCARAVNSAQPRLLTAKEAGDEGWYGTWAEMAFIITTPTPTPCPNGAYLTLPRTVARLEAMTVCDYPVQINNPFYEYLQFGNGRMPKHFQTNSWVFPIQSYSRNNACTFIDLFNAPQYIAAYFTNPGDVGKRVFMQGVDNLGNTIVSQDGFNQVQGQFEALANPFVQWPMLFSQITGIQKDITMGQVQIFQVDPTTGSRTMISTMDPGEQVADYRRYLIYPLPVNCCFGPNSNLCAGPPALPQSIPNTVTVTALAKLELIPVVADPDYLLIHSLEAVIEETKTVRYNKMDTASAFALGQAHHKTAIGLLNGELAHYYGIDQPAVSFRPFGSARLERQQIGRLI